ncbi:MAG: hypothetical protein GY756_13730, partial [bacterium]|nr:hypothetical protein [bacterium]
INLGLKADNIIVHPDNVIVDSEEQWKKYGVTILGSYVGTDQYVQEKINEKVQGLQELKQKIIGVEDVQARYMLLKWCFRPKIHYWLRTVKTKLLKGFITAFDDMKRDIMVSIINNGKFTSLADMSSRTWSQCKMSINDGGMGMEDLKRVIYAANIASLMSSLEEYETICPNFKQEIRTENTTIEIILEFQKACMKVYNSDKEVRVGV